MEIVLRPEIIRADFRKAFERGFEGVRDPVWDSNVWLYSYVCLGFLVSTSWLGWPIFTGPARNSEELRFSMG